MDVHSNSYGSRIEGLRHSWPILVHVRVSVVWTTSPKHSREGEDRDFFKVFVYLVVSASPFTVVSLLVWRKRDGTGVEATGVREEVTVGPESVGSE